MGLQQYFDQKKQGHITMATKKLQELAIVF